MEETSDSAYLKSAVEQDAVAGERKGEITTYYYHVTHRLPHQDEESYRRIGRWNQLQQAVSKRVREEQH